jgi:ribosomal protein L18E
MARAESKTVQVGLRIKEPLRAALEEAARRRGMSMNAEIAWRLERSFERRDLVDVAIMSRAVTDLIDDLNGLQDKALEVIGGISTVQHRAAKTLDVLYPKEGAQ